MIYIEDKNFIDDEQKRIIKETLYNENMPWFLQPYAEDKNVFAPIFNHSIIRRPGVREDGEVFNSNFEHRSIFMALLTKFCKKNNYELNEILRCSINFTFDNNSEKCGIHQDHDVPYHQLLIYLNDSDENSKTVVLDDDRKTVLKEIKPEAYKGVLFEGKPHYHYFPKKGYRIVCVYTFTGKLCTS